MYNPRLRGVKGLVAAMDEALIIVLQLVAVATVIGGGFTGARDVIRISTKKVQY
jgi:hypothetical protein